MNCPKCNSKEWDHANVGVPHAILCTDCGNIYSKGKQKMTQLTVIYGTIIFDNEPSAIIKGIDGIEHIEAGSIDDCQEIAEYNCRFYGGDYIIPSIYEGQIILDIKDEFVSKKKYYSLGDNPLDKFPSMWSNGK